MINPKQEKEDSYFIAMFASAIFATICFFIIFHHGDTGLKYMVLKNFSTQARGIVTSIDDQPLIRGEGNPSTALKNSYYYFGHKLIRVTFSPIGGGSETILIPLLNEDQTFSLNQYVNVLYLESNPKIAHPEEAIEHFSFDAALLKYTTLALALALTAGFLAFRRWQKFTAAMRNY